METFPLKSHIKSPKEAIFDRTRFCHRNKLLYHKNCLWQKQGFFAETSLFHRNKFISNKKWQRQVFFTETSLFFRNKFILQKQVYLKKKVFVMGKISLRKPVYITKTNFCPSFFKETHFCHRKKFWSQKNFCHEQKFMSGKNLPPPRQVNKMLFCRKFIQWKFTHFHRTFQIR